MTDNARTYTDEELGFGTKKADNKTTAPSTPSTKPLSDMEVGFDAPARGLKGWGQDIAATAVKGAIAVPEALVGLADIPTGGAVGKFLENEGGSVGFRPKQAREIANDWHSDATKQAQRKFQDADGVLDKTAVALQNPSLIATAVGESLPSMGLGGVAARGLMAATRLGQMGTKGAVLAGAAGEGATMAGSAAEQIRQESDDGLLTPGQAGLALATGVAGGAFGSAGGKLAQRLGIGDADTMLAQGIKGMDQQFADTAARAAANPMVAEAAVKSIPRKVIEGAIAEGFLEELPQSMAEQIFQNIALGKDWHEELDSAAVMGVLSGGAMGAGAAGFHGFRSPAATPTDDAAPAPGADPAAPAAEAAPQQNPGLARVNSEFAARLQALQEQEEGDSQGLQSATTYGDAVLSQQQVVAQRQAQEQAVRDAQMAESRAVESPDDEIYQSTGATAPRPSEAMGLRTGPDAGPLENAAALSVDTGATAQMQGAAGIVANDLQGEPQAANAIPVVDFDEVTDPYERAMPQRLYDDHFADGDLESVISANAELDTSFDFGANVNQLLADAGATPQEIEDAQRGQASAQATDRPGQAQENDRSNFDAELSVAKNEGDGSGRLAGAEQGEASQQPLDQQAAAPGSQAEGANVATLAQLNRKKLAEMSDDELQQLSSLLPADHSRQQKIQKAIQTRAAQAQAAINQGVKTDGTQTNQAQQGGPQPTQAGAAQAGQPTGQGLNNGATPAENDGRQASAPTAPQAQAQELDRQQRAQRIADAGAQWTRMPAVQRSALAQRLDGVKPVLAKNMPKAQWENLNVDIQRKLADAMAPAAGQASTIRQGQIGMKLAAGEAVLTSSGRRTTAFPKVSTDTNRKTQNTIKAVDSWLMQNALNEARARGDEFNARQFEAALNNPQQADKDSAEQYLFGEQPQVVPSILKPLTAATEAKAPALDDAAHQAATSPQKDASNTTKPAAGPAAQVGELENELRKAKERMKRIKREKGEDSTEYKAAEARVRKMRQGIFDAEDALQAAKAGDPAAIAKIEAAGFGLTAEKLREAAPGTKPEKAATPDKAANEEATEKRGVLAKLASSIKAAGEKARKAAAELEARRAGRQIERELFRELVADGSPVRGKSQDEIAQAIRERLQARDQTTALNAITTGRLARAIHKALAAQPATPNPARQDGQAKTDAMSDAMGEVYGEEGPQPQQQVNFLLGFEHAMEGKTKSTLTGDGLDDMLKGYEAGRAWAQTDEGAKWYTGKGGRKLQNTGVDLRRHWEDMKAQMKAGESDVQKAWAQIERATTRADLFAPLFKDDNTPGLNAYLTEVRSQVIPFKKWLMDGYSSWYGSTGFGRSSAKENHQFMLEGRRYPGNFSDEDRAKWKTDESWRIAKLQELANTYLDSVRGLIDTFDGATSVTEASTRFVDKYFNEEHREKARKPDQFIIYSSFLNAAGKTLVGQVSDEPAIVSKTIDFLRLRLGSDFTQALVEKETTYAPPSKATPLTPPRLDRVARAGGKDWRKGKDVTPQQFKDTFGFADVGFGNWVGARNDQDHLNYAYDAFMDMADHMGIAPNMVGFGGTLHFTIGALGHGKHAAHYAHGHPGPNGPVNVINLTNTKGDGTVYHEWGHALDHNLLGDWPQIRALLVNMLSHKTWTRQDFERNSESFLSGQSYWRGNKGQDRVDAAIQGVRHYMMASRRPLTAYKTNADQLGKDYWGNDKELIARAMEAWATDTMGSASNSYLVNAAWTGEGNVSPSKGYRGTPYPTGEERKLFSQLFTALSKSIKTVDGRLHADYQVFKSNMPEQIKELEQTVKELTTREGMEKFKRQVDERKAMDAAAKEEKARQAAQAEREEQDRLAAEALSAMQPTVDAPPAASTPGALTDAELSAIFDEAAAELTEAAQETPAEQMGIPTPDQDRTKPVAAAGGRAPAGADFSDDIAAVQDQIADLKRRRELPVNAEQNDVIDAELAKLQSQLSTFELAQSGKDPAQTPAATSNEDKAALALVAEAAKLGVKGVGEAMSGLAKLFGGEAGRLNSFPAGFDKDTYEKAKPHFKAALTAFQDAGKTLKDLFKLLIGQFGDGVKPYAIQFAKDEGLGAQLSNTGAPGQGSPSMQVAAFVKARLESGSSFDWRELFSQSDAAFGGSQANGKYTPKDAYDAMEAGVNLFIASRPGEFSPRASQEAAQIITERLHRMTQLLPTQTKRTEEQDEMQQFSTVPALAFAANWVANITSADKMLEPSSGIGGLAVFAKNAGAQLVLNELSSRRAGVLREVFPGAKVTQHNAEQINNLIPDADEPSVVVMNPPFSATAGRIHGRRDTKVGALHVEQALKRMAKGGRLVAIVGEGMNMDRPAFREWWSKIGAEYDVRAAIPMDGSGYAKYGTTFDNAILVIDKVKPSGRKPVTTPASTYPELINLLAEIRNDRPDTNIPASTDAEITRHTAEQALVAAAAAEQGALESAAPAGNPGADVGAGTRAGRNRVGNERAGVRAEAGAKSAAAADAATGGRAPGASANAAGSIDDAAAPDGGRDSGVSIQSTEPAAQAEALTESVFENYRPQRLEVAGAKPHPGPLVQSAAMAAVLPPAPTYTPNLPAKTIKDGLLSVAQIEAVVYAGQAHSEMLPPVAEAGGKEVTYRRGFFIGDGTGVGKGREISGILLDNLRQGRKKHVWVSEKQGLMNDAKRDLKGVGGDDSLVFNQNKTKAEDAIQGDNGIIFTTYSTLRSGAQSVNTGKPLTKAQFEKAFPKGSMVKLTNDRGSFPLDRYDSKDNKVWVNNNGRVQYVPDTMVEDIDGIAEWKQGRPNPKGKKAGQSRLDQLVNWLGEDFDGVIAFDEAHNAGNALSVKGERGTSEPSAQALAVVELQKRLPNARVVYVSATGATQVSNLSFATRLGMWGQSTPFASVQNFVAEMESGGLAAMELVARDLKQMGAYMARSLSYDGVSYSRLEHELTPMQEQIYNRLAEAWQVTLQNMEKALEVTGAVDESGKGSSQAKAAAKSAYWGAQQRFFNQIITSMQMPTVLEQIERDIAAGEAVVLQLVNTNEAQQTRALAARKEDGESADLEELDLTPRDMLIQMVQNSFPVVQHQEVMDENEKIRRVPVTDADGNPVINREAAAMRDQLLQDLKDISVPDGPLEMVLNQFGVERVAEVTGRTQRVVRKADDKGDVRAQLESRGPAAARADAEAFMNDKKPILVFSDAGGTGFSFHADKTKTNQRQRKHYLIQPGWRADKAVQGFGRTHRTNQASAPHYYLASTNIPAQKRFLSAIARRLDQLGALTKGQRDTANQGMFDERDNLESKYATQAVRQFIEDGRNQRLDGVNFADFLNQTGLEDIFDPDTNQLVESKIPSTRLFLNRMLSLKLDMQNVVFDAFLLRMDEKIQVAQERGEFDAGLQTIRALESRVIANDLAYTDQKTGAETSLVEVELKHATTLQPFPSGVQNPQYMVNARSGKVYVRQQLGKVTLKTGAVVDRFRLRGTGGTQLKDATEFMAKDGVEPYRTVTEAEAKELWQAENDKRPEFWTERVHMVVGAMLPIWDRIKVGGTMKVARTQTVDGQRLLGMVVDKKNLQDVRKRLNVQSAAAKMTPEQIMVELLKGNDAELANGWVLKRARVSNELRIEITNASVTLPLQRELQSIGVMMESIQWKSRYFVPTGPGGVPVLQKLLASRPVVELKGLDDGQDGADGVTQAQLKSANFEGPAKRRTGTAQDKAVMQAIAEGKSARDVLRMIASGSKDPFLRQVASLLLKAGITPNIQFGYIGKTKKGDPIHGQYRGESDTIAIAGSAEYAAERIFMHEAMHAATMRALAKPGLVRLQMQKLLEHVRKQPGVTGFYGLKNVDEFVAEVFTNPDFQAALRKMNAPSGSSGIKTAWDGFVRILRSILGLKNDPNNVLSQALQLGVAAVREDMGLRKQGVRAEGAANFGVDDFSRNVGEGIKSITATNIKKVGSHKLTDWLKLGLQFLGRRQLTDVYGDLIPQMRDYDRLAAQMEADKNESGAEADELVRRWAKLPDEGKLADLMHEATLAQIDADSDVAYVAGDDKAQSAILKNRFKALSPEAQAVYREARDGYKAHHEKVREAIRERIERSELSSPKRHELLAKMDDDFFQKVKGVYFPLARFGRYVTAVKDGTGQVVSVSRAETMPEAESARVALLKAFPAEKGFSVGRVTLDKEFVASHKMVGRGFMTDLYRSLEGVDLPTDQLAELEDTLGQLYLSSLPDLSWAKHGIHRKGTPGFSQDARRAFAQNMFHGARYLAKLRYSDVMQDSLDAMQEHVDEWGAVSEEFDQPKAQRVVDEMLKRHDAMMNPKSNPLSTAMTSFGFLYYLGLSPAAAVVNLSQTALVAYPVMAGKWGYKKSADALLRASKESVAGKNNIRTQLTDKDEIAAYEQAVKAGVIDVTMAHDLAGISQGEDQKVSWALRPVMRMASYMFHQAELFNRQSTFMAAFRLAREAGATPKDAYEQAVKATYDGHFDYGAANRPRVMQGNVARVVLLFKQFGQNMIYTMARQAYQSVAGKSPEERRQARKVFAGLLTTHAMAAGVLGLPLVGPLLAAASMLGSDDDEPWDAEVALRNMLAEAVGQKPAEVLAKGVSRLTPWDVSGRVGLDNLIFPDVREGLEGQRWAETFATGMLGPVMGIGTNAARAAQKIGDGDYGRALEDLLPIAARNPIKAARYWFEGAQDRSGVAIKDEVSSAGALGQLVGFSPSEVRLAQEGKTAVMDADRRLNERRAELTGKFAKAAMKQDQAGMDEARQEIAKFNEKNPGRRITAPQLWQSVRRREQRIREAENGVYLPSKRRDAMEFGAFAFE